MAYTDPESRADCGAHPPYPTLFDEAAVLRRWDPDIKRAARAAANGGGGDEDDLAQQVRTRLLLAVRAFPDAPVPYIRAVITNTIRSALRHEFRRFTTHSPLATELNELAESCDQLVTSFVSTVNEEPAEPIDESACERITAVSTWAARLPRRLQDIYRYLYLDQRSQREAAALIRVSQPRVAQLHQQLLEMGREELAYLWS